MELVRIIVVPNNADLYDFMTLAKSQGAHIGGYKCTWLDQDPRPGLKLEWLDNGNEPQSLLYRSGSRADDIVLLNDFIYVQSCYKRPDPPYENVVPPLGQPLAVPYFVNRPHASGSLPEVDSCLERLEGMTQERRSALRTAMLWWLMAAREPLYEMQIVMLRTGFEILWNICRNEVSTALGELEQHIRSKSSITLPQQPVLQHYLIVSRHVRNVAAHIGDLSEAETKVLKRINTDCKKSQTGDLWSKWEDWDASVSSLAAGTFVTGNERAIPEAVEFFRFILYGVLIRLLEIDLGSVEFEANADRDHAPCSLQQIARYMETLGFSQ